MPFRIALVLVALSATTLAGQAPALAEFGEVFEWVRSVELQQTDRSLAVRPQITIDPHGGWLVIDPPEGQVRLHDQNGRLKSYFGRRGEGPGEFSTLKSVQRIPNGNLLTVDIRGRIGLWSPDGSKLLKTIVSLLLEYLPLR